MTSKLFLVGHMQRSAYWTLLALAAVIASAGVVADSVATVIGAMIVAPLMTPILGTGFAVVLADRRQIMWSLAIVAGSVVAVVAVGYGLGLLVPAPIVAETNSQVAGRVSPGLIDLVGALATGLVGAFALVRSDVSDTLPGVAIAISLVPPLAVAGLTLESGAFGQTGGALLLFATNVAAIIATCTALLLRYRVRDVAVAAGRSVGRLGVRTIAVVIGFLIIVSVPLSVGTYHVIREQRVITTAHPVAERWAAAYSWRINDISFERGVLLVAAVGPPPTADAGSLRRSLDQAGLDTVPARLSLVVGGFRDLPVESD